MPQLPLWSIEYLREEDGSDPFPLFTSRLPPPAQVEWEALIRLLQRRGDGLRSDRASTHADGLQEFWGDEVRIFYKCAPVERRVIVVGGLLPEQGRESFEAIRRKAERI